MGNAARGVNNLDYTGHIKSVEAHGKAAELHRIAAESSHPEGTLRHDHLRAAVEHEAKREWHKDKAAAMPWRHCELRKDASRATQALYNLVYECVESSDVFDFEQARPAYFRDSRHFGIPWAPQDDYRATLLDFTPEGLGAGDEPTAPTGFFRDPVLAAALLNEAAEGMKLHAGAIVYTDGQSHPTIAVPFEGSVRFFDTREDLNEAWERLLDDPY